MAKLGGIYIGVRADNGKLPQDFNKSKSLTDKAAAAMQKSINSISFAAVAASAAAFGAVMIKLGKDGFDAVEKVKLSTASLAATITSFAKDAETDLAGTYQQAVDFSGQLVLKMEELNAQTVATGENLTAMVETMAQGGVLLDINNKKQLDGFKAIANALALITQGQNADIQFRQEIRGLINGEVKATNMLARLLEQRIGGNLKEHIELWKEQGTLIENAGALLSGFQEGAKDLEKTWLAVGTTLQTTYDRVLRGVMVPVYEDIIEMGREITKNAFDQNSALNQNAQFLKSVVFKGWQDLKNITQAVFDIVAAFEMPLKLIGGLLSLIIDGWGQILAILPAITRSFKLITQAVFESVKMVGFFAQALWEAASLDFAGAAKALENAKGAWIESGKKTGDAFGEGFTNELSKRLLEYNKDLTSKAPTSIAAPILKTPETKKDIEKELKARQEANRTKYAIEIALAEQIQDDTWLIRQEGLEAAIKQHEDTQTKITQIEYDELQKRLDDQEEFNQKYNELGKSRFDLEREQIEKLAAEYKKAGADKVKVDEWAAKRGTEIARAEQSAKLDIYRDMAGNIAGTFQMISQAGGEHSKEAFQVYKAFAMAQAAIAGAQAILAAMSAPWPLTIPAVAVAAAGAAVQVATIAAASPPSYDVGGISNARGVYQTGNIQEAHVPIPSGKIPVELRGSDSGGQQTVQIILNNPVFQDLETQRQTMAQIATVVAGQVAPGAVVENYQNDGPVRTMVRGGMG